MLQDVLRDSEAVLASDDPELLVTKTYLADLYRIEGKLDLAEPLLREVAERQANVLGDDHQEVLHSPFFPGRGLRANGAGERSG